MDGQQGSAAEKVEKDWGKLMLPVEGDNPGFFPGMVKSCNAMADALEAMANSTETAKISIVAQLGILAFEIATAEAAAPATGGASMAAIPIAVETSKQTVRQILTRLAKEAVMVALKQAFQGLAINLLAQTIQVAAGNRKSLDGKELGMSAAGGAAGGVGGHLVGKGLGKAGTKLIGERMQSLPAQMVHGAVVGVAGDVIGQLATTGKVDASSLGGSALNGGASPGIMRGASAFKGKFNAGNIPHASDFSGGSDSPGSSGSGSSGSSSSNSSSGSSNSSGSNSSNGSGSAASSGSNASSGANSSNDSGSSSKPDSHGDSTSGNHGKPDSHEDTTSGNQGKPDSHEDTTSGNQGKLSDIGSDGHHIRQNYPEGANPDAPVRHDEGTVPRSSTPDHGNADTPPARNHTDDAPRPFSTGRDSVTPTPDSSPYQGPTANHADSSAPRNTIAPYEAPAARTPDAAPSPIWGDNSNSRSPEPTPAQDRSRDTTSHSETPTPRAEVPTPRAEAPAPAPTPQHSGPAPDTQSAPQEGVRLASGPGNFRTPTATQTSAGPESGPTLPPVTPDPVTPPPAAAPVTPAPVTPGPVSSGPASRGGGSTPPAGGAPAPQPRMETRTEQGGGSRPHTQEQRRREQEREQRRHEFNTREHTTPEAPVEPKRDVPTMGQQERLDTLGNLKPEERRRLAQDKEFVAELRKSSTPDEFAESAAHLLVEVDPRTVQGGAARHEAQQQLARLLRNPDVAERLLTNGVEVVVVPRDVRLTDVPAFEHLSGQGAKGESGQGRGWDDIRGVSDRKRVAITEENLLGEKTTIGRTSNYADGYSSTTHELAHAVHKNGLSPAEKQLITKSFQEKLAADSERTAQWPDGPRQDTKGGKKENYSSVDEREYFAQATNSYLSTNHGRDPLTGQARNNGSHWAGQHEQTLHPLLEQLYGKTPLAAHTGGRANPVDHTDAVSAVGDFFRMAEGRPETHDTPSPHEDRTPPQHENESHENRPHEDTDTVEEPSPAPPVRNSRPPLSEVPPEKRAQMLEWAFKEQARKDAWGNTEELDSPTVKIPLEGGGHLTVGPRDSDGRYPVTEHTPKLEPKPLTKSDGTPLLDKQKKQKFGDPEPVFENGKPVFVERPLEAKTLNELFEGKQRPETANPTDVKLQRPDNKLVSQIEHGGKNGVPAKKLDMHFDQDEHSFAHYSFTKGTKPGEEIDPHLTVDNAMATLFAKMAPPDGVPGRSHDNASQFLDARANSQNTTDPMTKLQYNQILKNEHQLAEVDNLHFNLADPKGKKVDPNPPVNLKEFTDFIDSSLEHLGAGKDLRDVITGSTERLAEGKSVQGPDPKNPPRPSHVKRELTSMIMDEGAKPDFARFVTLVTNRNGVHEVPPLLDKLMRDHNDTIGLTRAEIDQLRNSDKLSAELVNRIDAHFPAADERLRTAQAEVDDIKKRGKSALAAGNKTLAREILAEMGPAQEKLARAQADANEYRSSPGAGGAGAIHEAIADHHWNTIKEWVRDPLSATPEQSSSSSAPPEQSSSASPAPPGDADLPSPAPPADGDLPSPRAANEGGTSRRGEQDALEEAALDLRGDPQAVLDRLEAKFGTPDAGSADRVRQVLDNGGSFDQVLGAHLGHALDSGGSGNLVYAMQNGASADTVKYLFGSGERTPDVVGQLGTHPEWVDPKQMGRWLMGSTMQGRNEPLVRLNEGLAQSGHGGGSLLYLGGDADIEHALFTTGTKDLTIVSTDPSVADRTQFLATNSDSIKAKLEKFGPDHTVTAVPIGTQGTHFTVTDASGNTVADVRYHSMTYDEFLKGDGPGAGQKFDFVMEKDSWFSDWKDQSGASLNHADIVGRVGDSLNNGGHWIGGFEPGVSAGTDQLFHDRTSELTTHANTHWGGQEQLHVRQRQDQVELPPQQHSPSVLKTFEIADSVLQGHPVVEGMSVADFHEHIVTSVAEYALAYRDEGDRHTGLVSERLADWFRDGGNERPDPVAIRATLDEALARADADEPSPAPPGSPEEIHLDAARSGGADLPTPAPPSHPGESRPEQNRPRTEDQPAPPPPSQELRFGPVSRGAGSTPPAAGAPAPQPRTDTRTEPSSRPHTQEQRQREQEREQRRHEFDTREHTTPETPVEPKRDVPTMGQQERLHTLDNLKPEERRALATDQKFVAELRKSSTPDEFAESAAHLLVEVDPRTVQGGAARHEAQQQLARMLGNPDVAERMLTNGVEVVVVPKDVRMTDVPAFADLNGRRPEGESGQGRGWDDVRGSALKKVAITEENLLGEKTSIGDTPHYADGYSSTTHEFAHAIHEFGLSKDQKLAVTEIFEQKKASDGTSDRPVQWPDGPRQDTDGKAMENYSSIDQHEYFAQATNSYLSTNHGKDPLTGQARNNGPHWAGRHEPALHSILENLYGKDPLAAHPGGRANPVNHTEAMSGVGDFFRMAEGRPDETPAPHEEQPHPAAPHDPASMRPDAPSDDDGSRPAPPGSTAPPASGGYEHKIDGKKAVDAIEKFLGDSKEFAQVRHKVAKYERADLVDADTTAMLAQYRQQKHLHVDMLSRNAEELSQTIARLEGQVDKSAADLGALSRAREQQDRMAIFEHERLKDTLKDPLNAPELAARTWARRDAEARVLPGSIERIKLEQARNNELLATAKEHKKNANKDTIGVYTDRVTDLDRRRTELEGDLKQREKDLADARKAPQSPAPALPPGFPPKGGVPEPTTKQDWQKLDNSYRTAFGYSDHGVLGQEPHAEKVVVRSGKRTELAPAKVNRNHVIADYMVHKYVAAAVFKARSLDPDSHRAASEAFGDFVTDMAPDRHRIYDKYGNDAAGRLATGGLEEAVLVRRDLEANEHTVDLGATYGSAFGKAFDLAGVGDHQSALKARAELEHRLGRSGLDVVARPELDSLAKAVDGVHPGRPTPEQLKAVHDAVGQVQQKVKQQAVEDLALINGVTGPRLLDDTAAALRTSAGSGRPLTPASRERLAGQLDDLAARYTKAGGNPQALKDLAGDLRTDPSKAGPDQLRKLADQLPNDRAALRQGEVTQRLGELDDSQQSKLTLDDARSQLKAAEEERDSRQTARDKADQLMKDAEAAEAKAKGDAAAEKKAANALKKVQKKQEEAHEKLAAAERNVTTATAVRDWVHEVYYKQGLVTPKEQQDAARVAWAVADQELVGKQYGGAFARAGAGENHPAGMFDQALTARVEDVPGLIEEITAGLSNSASNLRFGDETVNKWIQNFLDPHVIRDPDVLTAVAHGQLPAESLYSPHTADLLQAVYSLEANGLAPKELRALMAPKTQADMENVLTSGKKVPSPSAVNIGDDLHILDDKAKPVPVSSSGDFANRPGQRPGPLPAGAEALPKPPRDTQGVAAGGAAKHGRDSDADQLADHLAELKVQRRNSDGDTEMRSPAPPGSGRQSPSPAPPGSDPAATPRGFGSVHQEHEQQTAHEQHDDQQTPHEPEPQHHEEQQAPHEQQDDQPPAAADDDQPAAEPLLPPVGTVERWMVEDPASLFDRVSVSVDFPQGVMQRMPGVDPHRANAFIAAVENSGQHWFTMVPDRKNVVAGKNGFVLTPAWEKYAEHDPTFPKPPKGVELPPVKPDHYYVSGSYVPYKTGHPDPRVEGAIGRTVVPLHPDPSRPGEGLVMTGGMNGCAYAITDVNQDSFTVWHFQSYSSKSYLGHTAEFRATKPVSDWFGLDEYMTPGQPQPYRVTNILKHGPAGWEVISHEVVEETGNHHRGRQNRRPLNLEAPTEADRVRMTTGTYHVTAREQLEHFDRSAEILTQKLDRNSPTFAMLDGEITGLRDKLVGQLDTVSRLQQPGHTLQEVHDTANALAEAAPGHARAAEESRVLMEALLRMLQNEPAGPNNGSFTGQSTLDNLLGGFDPQKGGHWIDRMRSDSERQLGVLNAGQTQPAGEGTGFGSAHPAPPTHEQPSHERPSQDGPEPMDIDHPSERAMEPPKDSDGDIVMGGERSDRKRSRDEDDEEEVGRQPDDKRRRTPSYENTSGVMNDRGYESFGPEHPLTQQVNDYVGGPGKVHPPMSNSLLQKVNPHSAPVHPAEGFRPGADLNACLENVEAYRDTHFGRPRVSGQTMHGTVEPIPGNTLWKRHDGPALFGDGPDGVQKLMDKVKAGGPGTFATVLGTGKHGDGHAVALVHDRDGTLRWADLTDRKVTTANGAMPDNFGKDWTVWASVAGPGENNISGPHDPDFMARYSTYTGPRTDHGSEPMDVDGFGTSHTNPDGHSTTGTFPPVTDPPKPAKSWAAHLPLTSAAKDRDDEKGARRQANADRDKAANDLARWMSIHAGQRLGRQDAAGVWHLGSDTANPEVSYDPATGRFTSRLDPTTLNDRYSGVVGAARDLIRNGLRRDGNTDMDAHSTLSGGDFLVEYGRQNPETKEYWATQDTRVNEIDAFADTLAAEHRPLLDAQQVNDLLPEHQEARQHAANLLEQHDGFVLGENHRDASTWSFLKEQMPALSASGVRTVYLEHFRDDALQAEVTAFMGGGAPSLVLDKGITRHEQHYALPAGSVLGTLTAAREHNVDVQLVDGYPARRPQPPVGGSATEAGAVIPENYQRARRMNAYTVEAIREHRATPGVDGKYVVVLGAAHVGLHQAPPGLPVAPGVSESLGVPGVAFRRPEQAAEGAGTYVPVADPLKFRQIPQRPVVA
ncbi:hypothetical protein GCM10009664_73510 [Kitasatospora gansuensis]